MSLIAVLSLYSKSYSQIKPQIDIKIIDKDTLFTFNKPYAAYLISKFDSLKHFRSSYFDCTATLDSAANLIDDYKKIIDIKDDLVVNLNKQVLYCDELAESYNKSEVLNKKLQEDLQRQLKKTRLWNTVGWAAISTTVLTSIFILIK
jgi:hypothetical protein